MLRNALKNLLAALLYGSGLLSFLIRRRYRNRIIVLTYHRVLPNQLLQETFSHEAIIVSPQVLQRHISTLKRHFKCLSLGEFNNHVRMRDFPQQPACLITFDDAWQDNYTYALPILKQLATPAVIFVPTDYIGTGKLFWQERLGHLVHEVCRQDPDNASEILKEFGWEHIPLLPEELRINEIRAVIRSIKSRDYVYIMRITEVLVNASKQTNADYRQDRYLTLEQMAEMEREGVSFQSHACSHRILTRLEADELDDELRISRQWIRINHGKEPTAIAYPNGDHNEKVVESCARNGYSVGFTTLYGHVTVHSDPYTLRRVNISNATAPNEARLLLNIIMASFEPGI